MKITSITLDALLGLSWEEKWDFICKDIVDDGESADVALLLGTSPARAVERAMAAAELYRLGRVKYILPSGGVKWEWHGTEISEAELMRNILVNEGVPETAILMDNEARTTIENMVCGTLVIARELKLSKTDSVIIVTSQTHMKRSMALAKALLPRKFRISACPAFEENRRSREAFLAVEENRKTLDRCITLIKRIVDNHVVEDMEIEIKGTVSK